jgi:hypothetical protein
MPTMMAMLQKNNPQDRSLTNGLFLASITPSPPWEAWLPAFVGSHAHPHRVHDRGGVALVSLIFVPMLVDENGARAAASSAN